ncbi:Smg-4/UPF3 family-domain-containing protein [Lentinula edodes]|uniref:Smg-4/UPF3 family-domain-containing protein n=1 Tax=Lentinula edodes TaxID=5353 RepID=UPI001E8CFA3C|nr:Smg-4/UPF3 family-domain-containing protein [Lentinula edodes]KAH7871512.1 Smg-4/UPF3 family-domain-containing protein [Lentinula edodes]
MTSTITTAHSASSPAKSKKDRVRGEKGKDKERKDKIPQHEERLKTIVRKLPPNLPEEIFWQSVQTWVTDETVSWKIYYPGKFRRRLNKENVPSRAYILFKNEEQLALFSKEYDGHLFRDKSGNEAHAVVEFAPYQKVPPEKKKLDPRNGTIEKDENYISFIESLTASANREPVSIETLIASTQPVPQPKTTPLLEALKAEKNAIKEKAAVKEKASRKEDAGKKKGGKTGIDPSASSSAPPPSSKKALNKKAVSNANNTSTPTAGGPAAKSGASRQQLSQPQTRTQPSVQPPTKLLTHNPPVAPSNPESQSKTDPSSSTAPTPAPRLASRQFEAALSGAGVNAAERKSRKEREKEREAAAVNKDKEHGPQEQALALVIGKDAPSISTNIPTTNTNNTLVSSGSKPPSPKRDRGGSKRKNSVSSNSGTPIATTPKVPSILQRAVIADVSTGSIPPVIPPRGGDESVSGPSPSVEAGSGIRGGRRGRGRGARGALNSTTPARSG